MTSTRFEIDDIALSNSDSVILAKGKRRIALHKLSQPQIAILIEAASAKSIPETPETDAILAKLRQIDFPFGETGRKWRGLHIKSTNVVAFAKPLIALAHPVWIGLFLFAGAVSVGLLLQLVSRFEIMFQILAGPISGIFGCILGFWLAIVAHEAGHAAACLRSTGMVGGIRVKVHWGMPALATDVSAIAIAREQDRKWINLAGPAWHMATSVLIYYSTRDIFHEMATGALIAFPLAFIALVPVPGFDGFWIFQDAVRTTISGPLRIPRKGDIIAPVYCWVLLAACSVWLVTSAIYSGTLIAINGWGLGTIQLIAMLSALSAAFAMYALFKFLSRADVG